MHVVTRKHLLQAGNLYPDAAKEIQIWYKIAAGARWKSFFDVRQVFADADAADVYVIFNVRRNRYRLLTIIHYARDQDGRLTEGHIYIRSFLTHQQYENRANWDKGVKQ